MKKYIHVTKEVRERLMKIFGVSSVMVWKALTFESESTLANKIRKAAFENFGILMNELQRWKHSMTMMAICDNICQMGQCWNLAAMTIAEMSSSKE